MINCNNRINKHYLNIISEFRNLIDFINNEDVLLENLFNIIRKYFNYDAIGIFFNSPDLLETNVLNLYFESNLINKAQIKNKFFKNIKKYKPILKSEIKVFHETDKLTLIRNKNINELILPFCFNNNLTGGICIFSKDSILKTDLENFNLIINELLSIFKLKYIFTEQIFKSSIDPLTNLYNRNQFEICLNHEFNRAKRYNNTFTIAMIDIDHFKNINDTYGHQFGDYILVAISKIIQESFRKTDSVYRYGGEEIVIIMPETNKEKALLPLEKIRKKINNTNFKDINISISIGASDYTTNKSSPETILKHADENLYKAKESGRNKTII